MSDDKVRSEWNSNQGIAERIATLTDASVLVLRELRYDSRRAADFLDVMRNIWSEINAVSSLESNAKNYATEIAEVNTLFSWLYNESNFEIKRWRFGKPRGASPEFLSKSFQLKDKVLILGQRLGFGMNTKRYGSYDDVSNIRRASPE